MKTIKTAKTTKVAKPQVSKIQIGVNAELIARLIKQGRKTAALDYYANLTGSAASAAIEVDAQAQCDKAATALNKATTDAAKANAVIALLDNARSLNFKTLVKGEKAAATSKPKVKVKATTEVAPKTKKTKLKAKATTEVAPKSKKSKAATTEVAKPKKLKLKAKLEKTAAAEAPKTKKKIKVKAKKA